MTKQKFGFSLFFFICFAIGIFAVKELGEVEMNKLQIAGLIFVGFMIAFGEAIVEYALD